MVDDGFELAVVVVDVGELGEPDADVAGLEADGSVGDGEVQAIHVDRREGAHRAGFEMQDFAGIGGNPGAALQREGIVSFESAKTESAAGPVWPLAKFDEPGGLAVPGELAVTLHVVIGLEGGKKEQGHFGEAAALGSDIGRSSVRGVAALTDDGFVTVLLKDDDVIVNLGAESLSEGLAVLGAERDVFLGGEVLKIVDHGRGALTGKGEDGREIAGRRRRDARNGGIERGRIPDEAAVFELFFGVGRLRRDGEDCTGEYQNS